MTDAEAPARKGAARPAPPGVRVAVVLERLTAPSVWEDWRFRVAEVVPDEGAFGTEPRLLHDDGKTARWLHPGFDVTLHADECKGYFLNLTSGRPAWFVSWREVEGDASRMEVTAVSVSYIEADRRMFAEERVENLPLPPELCEWLREFTNAHFVVEGKRMVRAHSFLSPVEREQQMARDAAALSAAAAASVAAPAVAATAAEAAPQGQGPEPALSNEALRALIRSEPHFQTGDGLDVTTEEVCAIAASPVERRRTIERARALGLLDDDLTEQRRHAAPGAAPPADPDATT